MGGVACELLEPVKLAPNEEKVVRVRASAVVNTGTVLEDFETQVAGLSINEFRSTETRPEEVNVCYQCMGDGSRYVDVVLHNCRADAGIHLDVGTVVASARLQSGVGGPMRRRWNLRK